MPKSNSGDVEYAFKPGPFSRILWNAYHNPSKKYYLIIEEINRGNAAAIFGEVFQLLDRIETSEEASEGYSIGWSKYSIENENINAFLRSNEDGKETAQSVAFANQIEFNSSSKIRLPPNLAIYATMNTSDQNVFTLVRNKYSMVIMFLRMPQNLKYLSLKKTYIMFLLFHTIYLNLKVKDSCLHRLCV